VRLQGNNMIEKLIQILNNIGLKPTAEEIADILWLASHLDAPQASETANAEAVSKPDICKSECKDKSGSPTSEPESAKTGVYASEFQKKEISNAGKGGLHIRIPGGLALPGQLAIERALRPLMRKVPSRNRFVLDEDATVRQIAETEIWMPIMRPEPSRWLDLIIVVDESPSMVIWQQTISELKALLERQGAFRNVRLQSVEASQKNPKKLIDPSGQRLILVISDCVSEAWYDGSIAQMMTAWKNNSLIAVVQMLPYWLWERTGLDYAESVYLKAVSPGTVNAQLEIEQSEAWFDETPKAGLPIPVITLEPFPMSLWAKSVAGMGNTWIPGVVLTPPPVPPLKGEGSSPPALSGKGAGGLGEEQYRIFRATATPIARRLAGYLAAVPLTLPIIHLVRQVMMPKTPQVYLAEVFLSGLIKRQKTDDSLPSDMVRYEFIEGVRDILISSNFISETVDVISKVCKEVSAFIDKNTGKPLDFQAMIADPSLADQALFAKDRQPFAFISAHVLNRLGGKYAELAKKLETQDESRKTERRTYSPRLSGEGLGERLGMKFVYIPPGEFMMGSPEDEPGRYDNEILHKVTLTKGFYMQTTQVTVGQWRKFAKDSGYKTEAETGDGAYGWTGEKWEKSKDIYWDHPGFEQNDDCPVTCVSWNDAQKFIKSLKGTYRLPTEAEWEHACRAGTTTPFHFGKCLSTDQANYDGNYPLEGCPKGIFREKTVPVGSFPPNAWGLYDMHGNVWEWCQDNSNWDSDKKVVVTDTYVDGVSDPLSEIGSIRVLRGGGWVSGARGCRSADRYYSTPDDRSNSFGFRLCFSPKVRSPA